MMKTNRLIFLYAALFTSLLAACDPGVEYHKVIQNDSDCDLMIYIYPETRDGSGSFYVYDSLRVNKHTEAIIFDYGGLGQTFEYKDCSTYADSLFARPAGNDTLKLNLNLNDPLRWTFSVLDRTFKQGGTCECRARITNDMIK
jgi:hypothetical protein